MCQATSLSHSTIEESFGCCHGYSCTNWVPCCWACSCYEVRFIDVAQACQTDLSEARSSCWNMLQGIILLLSLQTWHHVVGAVVCCQWPAVLSSRCTVIADVEAFRPKVSCWPVSWHFSLPHSRARKHSLREISAPPTGRSIELMSSF